MAGYRRAVISSNHEIGIEEIDKHIKAGRFSVFDTEENYLHSFSFPIKYYHVTGEEFESISDGMVSPSYTINLNTLKLEQITPPIRVGELTGIREELKEYRSMKFSIEPMKRAFIDAKDNLASINKDILEAKKEAGKLHLNY